jgi:small subunit ribosomal protein S4
MARYTEADCKLCRREGQKLFLKGAKCYSEKCPVSKRSYAPGQHGQMRKKITGYGQQLREKQKAKRYYGVLESQFRKYFDMAIKQPGVSGENLLRILESRLDNIVYRLGFASSRKEGRQMVLHRHFTVNGSIVNIPSYLCKAGDVIAMKDASRSVETFKDQFESNAKPIPAWLSVDKANMTANVAALPTRDEIDLQVEERLIVELYSK